ncbi:MAG: hypothetical protein ABIO99_06650 [Candidatus Limnocylindria bacterium]
MTVVTNLGRELVSTEVAGVLRLAWPSDVVITGGTVTVPPDGVVVTERDA